MQKRLFRNEEVSEVGLGCWQFGGDWGQVSDEQCLEILRAAAESGVTFFDTADVYGSGRSETLIGRFLQEHCGSVFVATKLGRKAGYPDGYSFELFQQCTEDSLRRLGVETVDLTQLHCVPMPWLKDGEVFDWLRTLRKQGKIRHFGASVESMDEAMLCLEQPGLSSLQIIFNIFRHKPIDVLFDKARAKGVAIIVRLPLASGLLAGKFTKDTTFDEQDHRTYNRDGKAFNVGETFAGLPFERGIEAAEALRPLVPDDMTMARMAMRWILDHDAVTTVIPGATRADQARENATVSDLPPLSDALHAKIRAIYESQVKQHIRGPY